MQNFDVSLSSLLLSISVSSSVPLLLDGLLIHGLLGVHWLLLGVSSVLLLGDSSVLLLRWLSVNNLLGLRVDHLLLTVLDGLGVDDLGLSVDNLRLLRLLLELLTEAAAAHAEAAEAALAMPNQKCCSSVATPVSYPGKLIK